MLVFSSLVLLGVWGFNTRGLPTIWKIPMARTSPGPDTLECLLSCAISVSMMSLNFLYQPHHQHFVVQMMGTRPDRWVVRAGFTIDMSGKIPLSRNVVLSFCWKSNSTS